MLATLADRRDFGEEWLLERKFDGERCVVRKDADAVRLESRTGRDLTGTYPELRAALEAQRLDRFLLDGEVVVFQGEQTSFSRLQRRLGVAKPAPTLVEAFAGSNGRPCRIDHGWEKVARRHSPSSSDSSQRSVGGDDVLTERRKRKETR
jgi:hypothetical protein